MSSYLLSELFFREVSQKPVGTEMLLRDIPWRWNMIFRICVRMIIGNPLISSLIYLSKAVLWVLGHLYNWVLCVGYRNLNGLMDLSYTDIFYVSRILEHVRL